MVYEITITTIVIIKAILLTEDCLFYFIHP